MSRFFVLVNVAITTFTMAAIFSEGSPRRFDEIEGPVVIRSRSIVHSGNRHATTFADSPSLLFLHLFKHKKRHQKLEKITTTPASGDCICVPFYLCNANQTIITDGVGTIDVRIRKCTGDFEVCCYPPNIAGSTLPPVTPTFVPPTRPPSTPPATIPITFPSSSPTTLPPVIFPTTSLRPPVSELPNLNCVCVDVSLCDANGIVTISGEGVINPRQRYGLCINVNQVCCRILLTVTQPPTDPPTSLAPRPTVTMSTTSLPPGQTQVCFMCGSTIQCITCGITSKPGTGVIDPRLFLARDGTCSTTNSLACQTPTLASGIDPSSMSDLLGPLKNPGTTQACYCVKTWLCSEGNAVSLDVSGIIDSRFTACKPSDEICCRLAGIDIQALRSGSTVTTTLETSIISESSTASSIQTMCGIRNNTYAPSQPFLADSGKTYFAEFPWMVALLTKPTSGPYIFQCGASMINTKVILTAAHCVVNKKPENLIARFGQWDIENNTQPLPTQEVNISTIILHPSYYSGGLFHDVAVLILEKSVTYRANALPICLPEQGLLFAAGSRCYGTGWGRNSFGPEGKYQTTLRKVDLPIVNRDNCETRLRSTRLGQHFQLHGSFICAGGEVNRDMCRGDGGGPLVCQGASGQFFQAGIVSWGIGCGTSNVPAVYTSVSQHRQWIDRQLATYGVQ